VNLAGPGARLAAGFALAGTGMVLTHPLAIVVVLVLAIGFALALDVPDRAPAIPLAAAGTGVAVLAFNALLSWQGETVLFEPGIRFAVVGRPRFTLEAIAWGTVAGAQLAAVVLALGAATVSVPPETLHRAMARVGLPGPIARAGTLALRMVPDTARDARAMRDGLRTRGVDTSTLRGLSTALVPLAARALDRARVAEEALLMRGYDPQEGDERGLPPVAWLALAGVGVAVLAAAIGPGRATFYPDIAIETGPSAAAWLLVALTVPTGLVAGVAGCSR